MEKQKYIGITIGPISDTLMKAKHTRELWGASFLFSDTIKQILILLKDKYEGQIILPYTDDRINDRKPINYGAGLYPDRIILKSISDDCFDDCKKYIEQVEASLVEKLKIKNVKNFDEPVIKQFIDDYFKIYALEIVVEVDTLENSAEIEDENNPIFKVNNALDVIELRSNILLKNKKESKVGTDGNENLYNPLEYFLDGVNRTDFKLDNYGNEPKNVGRYKHIHTAEKDDNYNFPTVAEISTIALQEIVPDIKWNELRENDNDNESIIDKLKAQLKDRNQLDLFKFRHKYYCVVQADGDNISKIIRQLKNNEDRKGFSKTLFEFSEKAAKIISDYGGKPIYVGGDDLLFLCPIVSIENNIQITLFDLITSIDKIFDNAFDSLVKKYELPQKPSVSYGIAVHYVKYPLYEALQKAQDMLFKKAKVVFKDRKNAVALYLQKHSGQNFELILSKDHLTKNSFDEFKKLINEQLEKPQMLKTMIYKIRESNILLQSALSSLTSRIDYSKLPVKHPENRLDGFFKNFFNEPIHKRTENQKYIQNIKQLLVDIYFDHQQIFKNTDNVLSQFYNALRIIHFIQQEDSND